MNECNGWKYGICAMVLAMAFVVIVACQHRQEDPKAAEQRVRAKALKWSNDVQQAAVAMAQPSIDFAVRNAIVGGYAMGALGASPDEVRTVLNSPIAEHPISKWLNSQTNSVVLHARINPTNFITLINSTVGK